MSWFVPVDEANTRKYYPTGAILVCPRGEHSVCSRGNGWFWLEHYVGSQDGGDEWCPARRGKFSRDAVLADACRDEESCLALCTAIALSSEALWRG